LLLGVLEGCRDSFGNQGQYQVAWDFLNEFFEVMENDNQFEKYIIRHMREH